MEWNVFLKRRMLDFLLIQAGVNIAIGLIGLMHDPNAKISYDAFFTPFIYAFFSVLPTFVTYSSKELSTGKMAVRKVLEFVLIELVVLCLSIGIDAWSDFSITLAIMISVMVIYGAVTIIDYLISRSFADQMTKHLKEAQRKQGQNDESNS